MFKPNHMTGDKAKDDQAVRDAVADWRRTAQEHGENSAEAQAKSVRVDAVGVEWEHMHG